MIEQRGEKQNQLNSKFFELFIYETYAKCLEVQKISKRKTHTVHSQTYFCFSSLVSYAI